MKRFILAFCLLFSVISFAQSFEVNSLVDNFNKTGQIKGVVLDKEFNNEPLAFATIKVKDTNISVDSELDGTFTLNLEPRSYTITFTFIGYKTIEIKNVIVNSNTLTTCNQTLSALNLEPTLVVSRFN